MNQLSSSTSSSSSDSKELQPIYEEENSPDNTKRKRTKGESIIEKLSKKIIDNQKSIKIKNRKSRNQEIKKSSCLFLSCSNSTRYLSKRHYYEFLFFFLLQRDAAISYINIHIYICDITTSYRQTPKKVKR